MKLDDIANLLKDLDTGKVAKFFPTQSDEEIFKKTMTMVGSLVDTLHAYGTLNLAALDQIEVAAAALRDLHQRLSPRTELGGKATLNEAVLWAEIGHLERSIYLAGIAKERNVKEPYKSQLNALPANACGSRYRQISKLHESVSRSLGPEALATVAPLFNELQRSYLAQFLYFSGQAYMENKDHPMIAYNQTLALLMKGHELEAQGCMAEAAVMHESAYATIDALEDPKEGEHYLKVRYHLKNRDEFKDMRRLSNRHPKVTHRIDYLASKAARIQGDSRTSSPTMSYSIAPIVGWGARSASVLGLLISIAPLAGWDTHTISASIDALWTHAASLIPQLAPDASQIIHTSTGAGLELMAHTGGFAHNNLDIVHQLAALASHTGGFA